LPHGVEFPPLKAAKFGWEEYPLLDADGIAERCWRTDVVIALDRVFDARLLERMHKLGLLVLVGNACKGGEASAVPSHISVRRYPDVDIHDAVAAQACCEAIVAVIDDHVAAAGG
jgi:hypothetical protein